MKFYQLEMLNETLKTAQKSVYYRKKLPGRIVNLSKLAELPTINAAVLTREELGLVCVTQGEISRIVTLSTSGTTGDAKRVFFTEKDQELTVDYFTRGLTTLIRPCDTVAILLPCERPGGVGDLIARSLLRIPAEPVRYGFIDELGQCARALLDCETRCLIGAPVQILNLARYCEAAGIKLAIRAVLLSTDTIARIIVSELERIWGCEVFEHYGTTEMGLGGAIDCEAHNGYHIRENDLLFEVLDENGTPVPDGKYGELTFTTLTRQAMPFIRYRTGDITKIIPGRCACGSGLKRIAPVPGRIGGETAMRCGSVIKLLKFDEALFKCRQVSDFILKAVPDRDYLEVGIITQNSFGKISAGQIHELLKDLIDGLDVNITLTNRADSLYRPGAKRKIIIN